MLASFLFLGGKKRHKVEEVVSARDVKLHSLNGTTGTWRCFPTAGIILGTRPAPSVALTCLIASHTSSSTAFIQIERNIYSIYFFRSLPMMASNLWVKVSIGNILSLEKRKMSTTARKIQFRKRSKNFPLWLIEGKWRIKWERYDYIGVVSNSADDFSTWCPRIHPQILIKLFAK